MSGRFDHLTAFDMECVIMCSPFLGRETKDALARLCRQYHIGRVSAKDLARVEKAGVPLGPQLWLGRVGR